MTRLKAGHSGRLPRYEFEGEDTHKHMRLEACLVLSLILKTLSCLCFGSLWISLPVTEGKIFTVHLFIHF